MVTGAELAKALAAPFKISPYWRQAPTVPQATFLYLKNREALYGGAGGGGKSSALLMAALQYADVPGYAAILFRKSYADLSRAGALMDRARSWLQDTDAKWNDRAHTWRFPSGATLSFGYCENFSDVYAYQGAEFQFIGWDEVTQIGEREYQYLFSRLRRLSSADVPLRVRAASNPGGEGHVWVRNRFLIQGPANGRVFIPAKLTDNPHLDQAEYARSLAELDPVTRRQIEEGDWSVRDKENALVPEWTEELAAACTREVPRPVYFTPYVVGDLGSRDLTVWLFAWWDFENTTLVVEDELVLKDPSTAEMISKIKAKEKALWGERTPRPGQPVEQVRRFSDVDWRLVKDFGDARMMLTPTKKPDALAARNKARGMIGRQQVVIHPRCRTLLLTLESAVWNQKRTDYARNESTGHADAWDALVYLVRNVDQNRNPAPPGASWVDQFGRRHQAQVIQSPAARALSQALKTPEERKKDMHGWVPGRRKK